MSSPPLHRLLWRASSDLAAACLAHPFVVGLADGSLAPRAFERYVAQDAYFLRAFTTAYALTAAKCSREPVLVRRFLRLLEGGMEELELHATYARERSIDLENVLPFPATSAYVDFLRRTAWTAEPGEIVAAMTPCMRLYAFLGKELSAGEHSRNPYSDWIATYSSGEFEALAGELESLLDELAGDTPEVRDAYRYAMQCELEFFTAPL